MSLFKNAQKDAWGSDKHLLEQYDKTVLQRYCAEINV